MFRTTALPVCLTPMIAALAVSVLTAGCTTSAAEAPTAGNATGNALAVNTRTRTSTTRTVAVAATRAFTIPAGTELHLSLNTAVASDTSRVEDAVTADLTSPVIVGGRTVLPTGTTVSGIVGAVDESGRVKGRALVALDFTSVTTGGSRYRLAADRFTSVAAATKAKDATKIGIGAGAGAVIGGLLGGKKGAAEGAAVGGGAGTGVVLATRGDEVRLATGADVSTQLRAPLTVRLRN